MGKFQQARVLVAGGNGFIGQHLVQRLAKMGAQVTSLGVGSSQAPEAVTYLEVDITDQVALKQVLGTCQFEYVFNLSGYINHAPLQKGGRDVIDAHYNGTLNLVGLLWWDGLKRFIQIGSSDEYGNAPSPQSENMREAPISPYSFAKTASTQLIQMLSRTEKFPGVVARFFLVYGPGQDEKRFLPQIIQSCLKDQSFPTSEGKQIRDFCYIDDVIDALLLAATKEEAVGEVFNIASGQPVAIRSVLEMVQTQIGQGEPQFGEYPYRPGENMSLYADVALAKEKLGWAAQVPLEEGVVKTIAFYRES